MVADVLGRNDEYLSKAGIEVDVEMIERMLKEDE